MTNDPKLGENVRVLLLTKVGFLPVQKWDANLETSCFPSNQTQQTLFFSVQRQMALARSFIKPERQLHFANSPN